MQQNLGVNRRGDMEDLGKACDVYFWCLQKICANFQGAGSPGVTVN